jgi:cyclophilin family peptidyl-prolyl cis-trans isomerase
MSYSVCAQYIIYSDLDINLYFSQGEVVEGYEVVQQIEKAPKTRNTDTPADPVTIVDSGVL